jgi:2-polyprenyl-6-hydroxyphenyl methylase/3-demethylubiquinone-9 3-methyltransferase
MLKKILHHLRRRFIDNPRGFGHPVPAAAFDEEFRSGHWRLLDAPDEQIRYDKLAELVRGLHHAPRLLDAGCGSGRLSVCFSRDQLAAYHGVDLSEEAIRHARERAPSGAVLVRADLETWRPAQRYDVIVINEVAGYFHDPAATLVSLSGFLSPGGVLIVSLYRWGNSAAIWRRIETRLKTRQSASVTNVSGDKTWDIRILAPQAGP